MEIFVINHWIMFCVCFCFFGLSYCNTCKIKSVIFFWQNFIFLSVLSDTECDDAGILIVVNPNKETKSILYNYRCPQWKGYVNKQYSNYVWFSSPWCFC